MNALSLFLRLFHVVTNVGFIVLAYVLLLNAGVTPEHGFLRLALAAMHVPVLIAVAAAIGNFGRLPKNPLQMLFVLVLPYAIVLAQYGLNPAPLKDYLMELGIVNIVAATLLMPYYFTQFKTWDEAKKVLKEIFTYPGWIALVVIFAAGLYALVSFYVGHFVLEPLGKPWYHWRALFFIAGFVFAVAQNGFLIFVLVRGPQSEASLASYE